MMPIDKLQASQTTRIFRLKNSLRLPQRLQPTYTKRTQFNLDTNTGPTKHECQTNHFPPFSIKTSLLCMTVRWIKKRYGLLLLATLLLWPVLGLFPLFESIVVNGLLLETYWQLAYLSITNVIAFFFAISVLRVLGSRNPGGCVSRTLFGDGDAPWGTKRVWVVALVSTFTPPFLALVFVSEFPVTELRHIGLSLFTVIASVVVERVGVWALSYLKCLIFGSHKESANDFSFEALNYTQCAPLAWSLPRTTLPA